MRNKNLQYFIGKVCTIFTTQINRNFKEENPQTFIEQPYHYFLGVIDAVEDDGILVTQVMTGLKSYFFMQNLVSISEEEVLNPENSKDAKVIDSIKQVNQEVRDKLKPADINKSEFIDVDGMSKMLKNIKN